VAKIIVVGTSQGGVSALPKLIAGFHAPFPAPMMVVLHIGTSQSMLPSILDGIDHFQAAFARHGEFLEDGHIYIAPPDTHMLLRDGHVELSRGPRENWARPAIDPLFRSAAQAYGPDAIGIVMSGRLNDGTAGLYEIKRFGGIAIVQAPAEAEAPEMPRSALENVPVDYCLPVSEMPRLLTRLVKESSEERTASYGRHAMKQPQAIIEPSAQTCPECGGAMREEQIGTLTRFRCHIGHAVTAEILAAQQAEKLDNDLSTVLRTLNERAALCRDIAEKHDLAGNLSAARSWKEAADEASQREEMAQILASSEWLHPESEPGTELEEPEAVENA
jgi:two-component system chemotaxis response regulator CheB